MTTMSDVDEPDAEPLPYLAPVSTYPISHQTQKMVGSALEHANRVTDTMIEFCLVRFPHARRTLLRELRESFHQGGLHAVMDHLDNVDEVSPEYDALEPLFRYIYDHRVERNISVFGQGGRQSKQNKLLFLLMAFPGVTKAIQQELKDTFTRYSNLKVLLKYLYFRVHCDTLESPEDLLYEAVLPLITYFVQYWEVPK